MTCCTMQRQSPARTSRQAARNERYQSLSLSSPNVNATECNWQTVLGPASGGTWQAQIRTPKHSKIILCNSMHRFNGMARKGGTALLPMRQLAAVRDDVTAFASYNHRRLECI